MNEQEIRKIVNDEIQKKLFRFPKIPPHKHDGTDNIRISQNDIQIGDKYIIGLNASAGGGTATLGLASNPSQLVFQGIAFNLPNYKATLTACAQLGQAYTLFSPPVSNVVTSRLSPYATTLTPNELATNPKAVAITNTCTFFDGTGTSWVPHVSSDPFYLVKVFDGSTIYGSIQITDWSSTSISLSIPLSSGWSLIGNIVVS